jgi:lincosamide nucleotidyltransferase A/C/D/E
VTDHETTLSASGPSAPGTAAAGTLAGHGNDGFVMTAVAVVDLLDGLALAGADVCLNGGWSVDALLGEPTRTHGDLDLWARAEQLELVSRGLSSRGVDRIYPFPGDRPWNFVLHDGATRRVDLHLYETRPDGTIHYGSALGGVDFPASALDFRGVVAGRPVRCEAPEWAVRWHTGYEPRPQDHHDVPRLCARYGLPLPAGF